MTDTVQSNRFLLNADEVAHRLNISRTSLYQWLSSGRIPSPIRLGRHSLWRAEEIRQWVAAGCPPRSRWKPSLN